MTYLALVLVFHPVPLTIVAFALVAWFIVAKGYWRKYKRVILFGAVALYAVDTAFALPRIIYAWRSPDHAVVHRQVPLPASLVLVNAECRAECYARLASGALTEVILIDTDRWQVASPPTRYRAGAVRRDGCPDNRLRPYRESELRRAGYCPEPAEIPSEGIF